MYNNHSSSQPVEPGPSSIDKPLPIFNVNMAPHAIAHDDNVSCTMIPAEEQPRWPAIRSYWQDAFSEFLGTMTLILFGDGVVAQVLLSNNTKGTFQSISWGWG